MLRMRSRLRRSIGIALVAVLAAACAPAAPPSPTAAPTKPAPTAAPAKAAEKPAAAPAPTQAPAAKPTAAPAAKSAEKPAAKRPSTPAEVFAYSGPDRQQVLEEGARREGRLMWYTSLIVNERARPLADAFRQKYPFIQVDIVRLEGNQVVARVVDEYRANRHDVDIYEQSYPAITGLRQAQALGRFTSPMLEGIPREVRDPDGYFVAERENPLGLAFNTRLVPEAEAPKTYDDLLDPKWKGKLSTQDTSQAIQYLGAMLTLKGEAFVRKLAQQEVTVHSASARAVTDLVIAGEVPMTAPSSVGHVVLSRRQGGPVSWAPLDQAPTALGYVAVASRAPHPHAAMLWIDFMLSEDGQKALVATGEGGTRVGIQNDYGDYKNFKKFYTDLSVPMDQYQNEFKKWTDLHKALFVKKAGP